MDKPKKDKVRNREKKKRRWKWWKRDLKICGEEGNEDGSKSPQGADGETDVVSVSLSSETPESSGRKVVSEDVITSDQTESTIQTNLRHSALEVTLQPEDEDTVIRALLDIDIVHKTLGKKKSTVFKIRSRTKRHLVQTLMSRLMGAEELGDAHLSFLRLGMEVARLKECLDTHLDQTETSVDTALEEDKAQTQAEAVQVPMDSGSVDSPLNLDNTHRDTAVEPETDTDGEVIQVPVDTAVDMPLGDELLESNPDPNHTLSELLQSVEDDAEPAGQQTLEEGTLSGEELDTVKELLDALLLDVAVLSLEENKEQLDAADEAEAQTQAEAVQVPMDSGSVDSPLNVDNTHRDTAVEPETDTDGEVIQVPVDTAVDMPLGDELLESNPDPTHTLSKLEALQMVEDDAEPAGQQTLGPKLKVESAPVKSDLTEEHLYLSDTDPSAYQCLDDTDAVDAGPPPEYPAKKKTRRGTRGKGRKINYKKDPEEPKRGEASADTTRDHTQDKQVWRQSTALPGGQSKRPPETASWLQWRTRQIAQQQVPPTSQGRDRGHRPAESLAQARHEPTRPSRERTGEGGKGDLMSRTHWGQDVVSLKTFERQNRERPKLKVKSAPAESNITEEHLHLSDTDPSADQCLVKGLIGPGQTRSGVRDNDQSQDDTDAVDAGPPPEYPAKKKTRRGTRGKGRKINYKKDPEEPKRGEASADTTRDHTQDKQVWRQSTALPGGQSKRPPETASWMQWRTRQIAQQQVPPTSQGRDRGHRPAESLAQARHEPTRPSRERTGEGGKGNLMSRTHRGQDVVSLKTFERPNRERRKAE
ncbi:uncharacterized protein [Hoplias malabaricus]|uniref:uncharacterized protein isoform X2 n=1 Tax=Hoplias malabaricus TaxID=27720 RepID=UPI003463619C